jgi:hypothetical protein
MHINPTVQGLHHLRQTLLYSLDNGQFHIRDRYCGEQHYPVPCSELNPGHRGVSSLIYESAQAQNQFRTLLQHEVKKKCVCSRCRLGSLTSRPSLCVQDAAREVGCWLACWLAGSWTPNSTTAPVVTAHLLLCVILPRSLQLGNNAFLRVCCVQGFAS